MYFHNSNLRPRRHPPHRPMAHCLLRPLCMAFPRASAFPKVSPALQFLRYKSRGKPTEFLQPRVRPQPSPQVAAKNMEKLGDIGLLDGTFVMPTGANLPGLFSRPGERFQLIKHRLKQRIMDLRDMIVFRYVTKHRLNLFEPRKVAPSLHLDMYTAFAEGDLETLRLICGEGLLSSFQRRIAIRGLAKVEWKRHKILGWPRVVSSKAHYYGGRGLLRRQAIVRIRSLQSLAKFTPKGELVEGSDVPKEITEYVVIEKKYEGRKESAWYVWGTTEETTLERLAEQRKKLELFEASRFMSS